MAAVFTATTTDADGCYEIAGLLPGAYALAVRSAEGCDEAHPVFVAGNSVTQAPDLWLPRAEGLTVRVRLVSAAGEPLSGQAVEFTATSTPVGGHISTRGPTDEAGVLVLSATCPGWYGFSLRCGDGSEAGCWGVPVTAQGQTTEPTLVARRPATCRAAVHVVATDGTPSAQRAWVFPVARQTEGGAGAADLCGALFTEADGVCTFTGLAPGSYVFVAQTPRGRGSDALGACMAVSPLVTIPPNGSADVTAVLETPRRSNDGPVRRIGPIRLRARGVALAPVGHVHGSGRRVRARWTLSGPLGGERAVPGARAAFVGPAVLDIAGSRRHGLG